MRLLSCGILVHSTGTNKKYKTRLLTFQRSLIIIGKTNKILFFDIFNQKIKKQLTFLREEKASFYEFKQLNVLFRVLYKQKKILLKIYLFKRL